MIMNWMKLRAMLADAAVSDEGFERLKQLLDESRWSPEEFDYSDVESELVFAFLAAYIKETARDVARDRLADFLERVSDGAPVEKATLLATFEKDELAKIRLKIESGSVRRETAISLVSKIWPDLHISKEEFINEFPWLEDQNDTGQP